MHEKTFVIILIHILLHDYFSFVLYDYISLFFLLLLFVLFSFLSFSTVNSRITF